MSQYFQIPQEINTALSKFFGKDKFVEQLIKKGITNNKIIEDEWNKFLSFAIFSFVMNSYKDLPNDMKETLWEGIDTSQDPYEKIPVLLPRILKVMQEHPEAFDFKKATTEVISNIVNDYSNYLEYNKK